jgi:hypothetical protein
MRGQSFRRLAIRVGISTRRSTTRTAARPEAAARDCSHARWRQEGEHDFGSRPVALTVIGPPHHPHVDAANLRACVPASAAALGSARTKPGAPVLDGGRSGLRAPSSVGSVHRVTFRRHPIPPEDPDDCPARCHPDASRRNGGSLMSSYVSTRVGRSVRIGGGCGGLAEAKSRAGTESSPRCWLWP